jgi:hypothetical protein
MGKHAADLGYPRGVSERWAPLGTRSEIASTNPDRQVPTGSAKAVRPLPLTGELESRFTDCARGRCAAGAD